jgi:hypothetical protein
MQDKTSSKAISAVSWEGLFFQIASSGIEVHDPYLDHLANELASKMAQSFDRQIVLCPHCHEPFAQDFQLSKLVPGAIS